MNDSRLWDRLDRIEDKIETIRSDIDDKMSVFHEDISSVLAEHNERLAGLEEKDIEYRTRMNVQIEKQAARDRRMPWIISAAVLFCSIVTFVVSRL